MNKVTRQDLKKLYSFVGIFFLCLFPQFNKINVYYDIGDLVNHFFTIPSEVALCIFADSDSLKYICVTANLENKTFFPSNSFLNKNGLNINNCIIILHSHLLPSGFSEDDIKALYILRSEGFYGLYGIYYPFNGKILYYRDK